MSNAIDTSLVAVSRPPQPANDSRRHKRHHADQPQPQEALENKPDDRQHKPTSQQHDHENQHGHTSTPKGNTRQALKGAET